MDKRNFVVNNSAMQKNGQKRPEKHGGNLWIFGRHACFAALQNPKRKIRQIWVTKSVKTDFDTLSFSKNAASVTPKIVDNQTLESTLGANAIHQGIALEIVPLDTPSLEEIANSDETHATLLILDQVTDVQNIGAILRSAAAFGIKALVLTEYNAPTETGAMAKAASGALELVPIIRATNLAQALGTLKKHGYWCIGLDGEANAPLTTLATYEKLALVMGAEGKGLRRLTREHCDLLVKIPIHSQMESLNVSNAAAIALYEATRGRE